MQRRARNANSSATVESSLREDTVEPINDQEQEILIETLINSSVSQNIAFRKLLLLILSASPLLSLLTPNGIAPISQLFRDFGHVNLLSCYMYLAFLNYANYRAHLKTRCSVLNPKAPSKSLTIPLQAYIVASTLGLKYLGAANVHDLSVFIISLINGITFYADYSSHSDRVEIDKLRGQKYHYSDA
ncbi:hypothetical protein TrST_g5621 [Triparma strigata]|uniref:Uncharacterized protein n=1 Tax=Triparma strigata TaxID=1606541 RepID=A0A9W7DVS5_9STRA|nr:hypothetical protein TrST_g5621 [Triparma strigata]